MRRVVILAAGASAFRPHSAAPRRPRAPLRAGDDGCAEAVEGDVVAFVFPETGDRPDLAGARRLGVVKAEMSCTAWVQPLVDETPDQDDCVLVEDESFEEPVQVQGGIEAVLDDAAYGQFAVPSFDGCEAYGAAAVECWTVCRDAVPAGVDVPATADGASDPPCHADELRI